MIPRAHITAWRSKAPWATDAQVEQDLVLSRALIEVYSDPFLASALAFRGGTALHKLYLAPPCRYSEDIDLVQVSEGAIGPVMDALRSRLDLWLGRAKWSQAAESVTLLYRFESEIPPVTPLRLKVEMNTREHFALQGQRRVHVAVENQWFSGEAEITTYTAEELLGTKLRALYQRKKGRDLFDLAMALKRLPTLDCDKIVECFEGYLAHEGARVSRAEFEANLAEKIADPAFVGDVRPLLASHLADAGSDFDPTAAAEVIMAELVSRLPGEPWKGGA